MRWKRKILCCIGILLLCGGLFFAAVWQGMICVTSAQRPENQSAHASAMEQSGRDTDGDGIDDRTDFLNGALAYVETRPRYQSKYYASGYPDDGFGVCADVVAFGLRAAGMDLQALVAADIQAHPEDYDIAEPDAAIDFRRVKNLTVYFKNHAISLTTDIRQTDAWQGGDIVIFAHHIGVVSDRRNENGVPYVIHHNAPFQRSYEEDILESRTDLVGHYRLP